MTAQILHFPRKPRLVREIDRIFDGLDSFGELMRKSYDPYANTPAEFEPRENNLRADGTPIVPCRLPTKGDLA